ncbi:lipid droplet-associated protein [Gordonia sp. TBRC 11910]|uniref:Lipid droplet-associated protein n=1 Tax=Gordonia asplenii TaxID=2725283 RepID=A0A848L433_9ACTN|nr:lipid droplet-associated protein [Gordonia asplenii]NMO02388.1 lipid droplet-associated protein [Gordonia asplenii]
MIRPPYGARVAAGLLVTALEETRKLPTYAVTFPMTAVSQALQAGMRLQQNVAELAIKGDAVFDSLFNQAEEQPSWAVFDEDEQIESAPAVVTIPRSVTAAPRDSAPEDASPAPSGRFALYSSTPDDVVSSTTAPTATSTTDAAPSEGIIADLDYDSMTLAQLRAKIRGIDLDDLRILAEHEKANRARTPFLTMLENRITAKSDK